MKVSKITGKDFLARKDLDLDLPKKISVFVGRNGAGKSSILDLIRVGLAGTARGVPRKDARDLASWGAKTWAAQLELEHEEAFARLRRTSTKLYAIDGEGVKHELKQATVEAKLGSTKTLEAVFDLWRALEMSASDRKALVFDLVGIEVDGDFCRKHGIEDPEIVEPIIGGKWKRAETLAAEKKRAYKRRLAEGSSERPQDPEISDEGLRASQVTDAVLADSKKALEDLGAKRDDLLRRIGAAEAAPVDRVAKLEASLGEYDRKDLEGRRAALKKKTDEEGEILAGVELERYEATVSKGEAALAAAKVALAGALSSTGGKHECAICGLEHEWPSPATEEDLEKLRGTLSEVEEKLGADRELLAQGRAFLAEHERALETAQAGLAAVEEEIRRVDGLEKALARAREEEVSSGEDPEELRAELKVLEARRSKGRVVVENVEAYRRALEAFEGGAKERRVLEEKAALYAQVEEKCRPDGLPAMLLKGTLAAVNERVEKVSTMLFAHDPSIEKVSLDADFEPFLVTRDGPSRALRTLNPGARWKAGLALADALAQLSGLRFLALDEVSLLDAQTRGELVAALLELEADYDQILLAAVLGDVTPTQAPEELPLKVYVLNDRRVVPA